METLHPPQEIQEAKDGWKVETHTFSEPLKNFLNSPAIINGKYSGDQSIHYSGGTSERFNELRESEQPFNKIEVLYENGVITQIHAEVGNAGILDVYITGSALSDFLTTNIKE